MSPKRITFLGGYVWSSKPHSPIRDPAGRDRDAKADMGRGGHAAAGDGRTNPPGQGR